MKWLEKYGPWLLLFVVSAAYFKRFISPPDAGMFLYPQAAQCMLDGQPIHTCAGAFTYPPTFAFVMTPFALLPMGLRLVVWYVITVAAAVGAYRLCERVAAKLFVAPYGEVELLWVRIVSLILSVKFVLAVLENQAYDMLSFIFIMLGLAGLSSGRSIGGGAALGFAAAIKATPLIFLPYLIVKKRFAAAAAMAVSLAVFCAAPDIFFTPQGASEGYFMAWVHHIGGASLIDATQAQFNFWSGANWLNHSLRGAVSLRIDEVAHPALHKTVLYGLDLAFIAFAGALIMLRKERRDMLAIDGSILVIATLMLSPMTSRSHYAVMILPYVTLTMVVLRDTATRWIGIAVLAVSFFFLTATSNDAVGQDVTNYAYAHSFLVIGALTLLIYCAVIVWNPATLEREKPFTWDPLGWKTPQGMKSVSPSS
ncbi:MAG: glycosyltransferase family 87 protein [Pseudolabrys sp.]|jgi:alpha-1,2-mannosyltransferase